MLYAGTTGGTTLYIPRHTAVAGRLRLELTPTAGGMPAWADDVTDSGELVYYYTVTLAAGLAPGEYQYVLTDEGQQVASGLLMVTEAGPDVEEYGTARNVKQYEG